jgi:endonuclease/exonuclease/phosphatase family metal-dependent hydrolase
VTPDIAIDRYEVVETDLARKASDHLPILADLTLPSD